MSNILKIISIIIIICLAVILAFVGVMVEMASSQVYIDKEKLLLQENSIIYDKNNNEIHYLSGEENRRWVSLDAISSDVINALIATEDRNFYEHQGIDVRAIIRAYLANRDAGKIVQGGSTITQQLVKICFLSSEKTLERKIQEAFMAIHLEKQYSKKDIIEYYLNNVYFGMGAYGIQESAKTYFAKDAKDLTLLESAYLIGLLRSPSRYSVNESLSYEQQLRVLSNMKECGFIDYLPQERTLTFALKQNDYYGSYMSDYVIEEAQNILGYSIFGNGLRIHTTIDSEIQKYMEEIYANDNNFLADKNNQAVESAAVLLNHQTGEIMGMMGGRNYHNRGLNRASQSFRQPGSAFKPVIVYALALERGMTPNDMLLDSLETYKSGNSNWTPRNHNHVYLGSITMKTAIKWSVNTSAVKLMDQQGVSKSVDFAKKFGISSIVESGSKNDYNLAAALGGLTNGVTPLELTAAYSVFANEGRYIKPYAIYKITDSTGKIIYEQEKQEKQVITKQSAYYMTEMLQEAVLGGTATRAQIPEIHVAGKTGTSEHLKDAWFVGYTPNFVCGIWMGYDRDEYMTNVQGGNQPALIWKQIIEKTHAYKGIEQAHFPYLENKVTIQAPVVSPVPVITDNVQKEPELEESTQEIIIDKEGKEGKEDKKQQVNEDKKIVDEEKQKEEKKIDKPEENMGD